MSQAAFSSRHMSRCSMSFTVIRYSVRPDAWAGVIFTAALGRHQVVSDSESLAYATADVSPRVPA